MDKMTVAAITPAEERVVYAVDDLDKIADDISKLKFEVGFGTRAGAILDRIQHDINNVIDLLQNGI